MKLYREFFSQGMELNLNLLQNSSMNLTGLRVVKTNTASSVKIKNQSKLVMDKNYDEESSQTETLQQSEMFLFVLGARIMRAHKKKRGDPRLQEYSVS